MSIRTKRAQRIAMATAAALTATAGLAVGGGSVSADLYSPLDSLLDPLPDDPRPGEILSVIAERGLAGDIRVTPTDYDPDDQTVYESNDQPYNFQLRGEGKPGSDLQVVLKNRWEAGDSLKLIVYPDGYSIREINGGDASYREDDPRTSTGRNCSDPTSGIGWSSVPTVGVEGPFSLNLNGVGPNPADPDPPLGMAAFFNEGPDADGNYWTDPNIPWGDPANYWGPVPPGAGWPAQPPVDVRTPGVAGLIAPAFSADFTTVSPSGDCLPAGVTDVLTLTFENSSTDLGDDANEYMNEWIINLSDVMFDLGATVPSGPAHVAVFPVDAPSVGAPGEVFGAYGSNMGQLQDNFITDTTIRQWTNPIFIQPAELTASAVPELLIDGTPQFAADVTFAEDGPDGFTPGCYSFQFSDDLYVGDPAAPDVIYNGDDTVPFTILSIDQPNDTVQVCITPTAGFDTIVITNVTFIGNDDKTITVELLDVPGLGNDLLADGDIDDDESFFASHLPDDRAGALLPLFPGERALSASTISDVNAPEALTDVYPPVPVANQRGLGDRIGGSDRYETSAKIANRLVECSDYAIVVSGQSYPDALSASYLAGTLAANYTYFTGRDEDPRGPAFRAVPILTTDPGALDENALTFLRTRGVDTVYIVGGPAAVSMDVQDELAALPSWNCGGTEIDRTGDAMNVERVGGADRYETNQQVIELAQNNTDGTLWQARLRHQFYFGESSDRVALMASGQNWPDALALGPLSYGTTGCRGVNDGDFRGAPGNFDRCKGFPLIITPSDSLGDEAMMTLDTMDIDTVVLGGGTAAVSQSVEDAIEAMGIRVIRLAGEDRIETAIAIADWSRTGSNTFVGQEVPAGLSWDGEQAFLARSDVFADALAGAPIVAAGDLFNQGDLTRRNVLLLTTTAPLSPATEAWLVDQAGEICEVTALGLSAAIANETLDDAQRAIAGTGQCFFGDRNDDRDRVFQDPVSVII